MTTRKRNEFLDIVTSDDEDNDCGYDSEAAEETKGRSVKRRRTQTGAEVRDGPEEEDESGGSEVSDVEEDEEEFSIGRSKAKVPKTKSKLTSNDEEVDEEEDEESQNPDENEEDMEEDGDAANDSGDQYLDVTTTEDNPKRKKPIDTTKASKKKNKTGVVYLSSLPPYLKPFALKSLLETRGFSPITKVFLTPSVRAPSAPRRRSNKRKTYTDGWVEFASKKTAKICAETLNASIVGGRKGGWYHDDVWNMKYLRGFKWADLMEQVQREKSEREAKRRIEDSRARKEERVFVQGYETGKMLDGIQRKNEEKRRRNGQGQDVKGGDGTRARRLFKQSEIKLGRDRIMDQGGLEEDTKRVLGKIF